MVRAVHQDWVWCYVDEAGVAFMAELVYGARKMEPR
jgi:hypothetical protein